MKDKIKGKGKKGKTEWKIKQIKQAKKAIRKRVWNVKTSTIQRKKRRKPERKKTAKQRKKMQNEKKKTGKKENWKRMKEKKTN